MLRVYLGVKTAVTSVNVPSATSAVLIGGRMLFSPSAYFGGAAAPAVCHLALMTDEPLFLRLDEPPFLRFEEALFLQLEEAQESALAADAGPSECQHQGERVAGERPMTQAAAGEFFGWAKGIAADGNDARVQAVTELSGANPQPRLTGPLLPRAGTAGPGPAGPAVRASGSAARCTRPRLSG
jgi:hypothetical protein